MSGNAKSSTTEHMDWTWVTEEDPLKVSLAKMDEKTHQAKVGLTGKAKQREAKWREREMLAAKAEARQLAKEERVAEERCWKEEKEAECAVEAENRSHTEEVARKVAEGSKGKRKAKPRLHLVSKAVSTFIFGCSDCLILLGSEMTLRPTNKRTVEKKLSSQLTYGH